MRRLLRGIIQPIAGSREQFYSIDIVRGLSAISLLVFHFFHFSLGVETVSRAELQGVGLVQDLDWVRKNAPSAVMLFWTISGFVFMNVYAGSKVNARSFFVNRFARLYPLHLITLFVVLVVQLISISQFGKFLIYDNNTALAFIRHLFFASAWGFHKGQTFNGPDAESFNGPVWSVSVEVLIYILFWLYIRGVRQSLLSVGLLFVIFAILTVISGNQIALCGAFFFAGATLYAVYMITPAGWRTAAVILSLFLFAAAVSIVSLSWLRRAPLSVTLLALFIPGLSALALSETLWLRAYFRRLRIVGDITYSTYMIHTPLQMLFLLGAGFSLWSVHDALNNAFFIGYLAITIILAYLSYRFFERPAQTFLRERLLHTRKPLKVISAP
jgi:peptidoglycan/LPS O-acetylase OafA/YrhL